MEGRERINDHIVDYLLAGDREVTDPVLRKWLDGSESNQRELEQYCKIWEASGGYIDLEMFDTNRAWRKVYKSSLQRNALRKRLSNTYYLFLGVAASLLLVLALSLSGLLEKGQNVSLCLRADYGNHSDIVLPDGSTVKLNSGSEVTYVYNSKEKIRKVFFQGEAFFDVSKSKKPFVIAMADGVEVKVLGTTFNLKAYPEDPTVRVSLLEGRVELAHHQDKLSIRAGEMAEFNKQTNELKPVDGNLSHSYGWLNNKLYMDNMSLKEVCKYLERGYNVNIHIQENLGEKIHYNGVIQEETITDVLEALSHLSNIACHVKGKNISITSK